MKLREFWEVASFCSLHPSMILRNHWGNEKEARKINALIDVLIENKNNVSIAERSKYSLTLEFQGNFYSFWIANKFYYYLGCGKCAFTKDEASCSLNYDWEHTLPSRLRAIRFFKIFDKQIPETKPRIKRNCLLLPQKIY